MATVNLGAIKFNWKGAYNNSTQYQVDDVVSSGGSSYICILASQGNAVSNGTYWEQMSAAGTNGTNGTDVGTVITTQGDILYRDGSGLQRLAKGTAGQVLRMNAAANAPEYGTVSSDWVRLATSTASNVSSLSIDGLFTSDYDVYKLFFHNLYSNSGGLDMYLKVKEGGSTVTGNYYYHINQEGFANGGIDSAGYTGAYTGTADYIRINGDGISDNVQRHACGHVEIFNPLDSSHWKAIKGYTTFLTSSKILHNNFFGRRSSTTAISGIEFSGSGSFHGKFHLYGMKNS